MYIRLFVIKIPVYYECLQDHHKTRALHVGRAESPDEAAFRSRARTNSGASHKSYLKGSGLLRHEKGHSKLPNVTKNDQTDSLTPCKCVYVCSLCVVCACVLYSLSYPICHNVT